MLDNLARMSRCELVQSMTQRKSKVEMDPLDKIIKSFHNFTPIRSVKFKLSTTEADYESDVLDIESDSKTESDSEAESNTETESEPEIETKSETKTDSDTETELEMETESDDSSSSKFSPIKLNYRNRKRIVSDSEEEKSLIENDGDDENSNDDITDDDSTGDDISVENPDDEESAKNDLLECVKLADESKTPQPEEVKEESSQQHVIEPTKSRPISITLSSDSEDEFASKPNVTLYWGEKLSDELARQKAIVKAKEKEKFASDQNSDNSDIEILGEFPPKSKRDLQTGRIHQIRPTFKREHKEYIPSPNSVIEIVEVAREPRQKMRLSSNEEQIVLAPSSPQLMEMEVLEQPVRDTHLLPIKTIETLPSVVVDKSLIIRPEPSQTSHNKEKNLQIDLAPPQMMEVEQVETLVRDVDSEKPGPLVVVDKSLTGLPKLSPNKKPVCAEGNNSFKVVNPLDKLIAGLKNFNPKRPVKRPVEHDNEKIKKKPLKVDKQPKIQKPAQNTKNDDENDDDDDDEQSSDEDTNETEDESDTETDNSSSSKMDQIRPNFSMRNQIVSDDEELKQIVSVSEEEKSSNENEEKKTDDENEENKTDESTSEIFSSDEEDARKELLKDAKSTKNNHKKKAPQPVKNKVFRSHLIMPPRMPSFSDDDKTPPKKRTRLQSKPGSDHSDIEILEVLPANPRPKMEEEEAEEFPAKPKKKRGRKRIKPLLDKQELDKETIEAQKSEKDAVKRRIKRAQVEKQINSALPPQMVDFEQVEPLVLDIDEVTREPLVVVDKSLTRYLKPHQVEGVKFMFDQTIESVSHFQNNSIQAGCVLAHCMGLGKTFQAITYLHTLMTNEHLKGRIRRALVICPLTTVLNWESEFQRWQANCATKVKVHNLAFSTFVPQPISKATVKAYFEIWRVEGGVGIINMEGFSGYVTDTRGKFTELSCLKELLISPGPDIVICDEGHKLKSATTKFAQAIYKVKTKHRIVLTGTPLQNNLNEYYHMINWVKKNLLGTIKEFRNGFVNPIENGQHIDSTDHDVRIMKKRSHVLHKIIKNRVQRVDYKPLQSDIPTKHEYVVRINMSEAQINLYEKFIGYFKSPATRAVQGRKKNLLLVHHHILEKLLAHPYILAEEREKKGGFVLLPESSDSDDIEWLDESSNILVKEKIPFIKEEPLSSDDIPYMYDIPNINDPNSSHFAKLNQVPIISHFANLNEFPSTGDFSNLPNDTVNASQVSISALDSIKEYGPKEKYCSIAMSGKTIALMEILQLCIEAREKLLVFSHRVTTLTMIAGFLTGEIKVPNSEMKGPLATKWIKNQDFYMLDGRVNQVVRKEQIKNFNDGNNRLKLFLISTKAGGLGINLTAANRVVIYDASWNPADDLQSIYRIYRYGQTKPCFVYRFVARGTIEEKVYYRQVGKESLAKRVVDEEQIKRHHKIEETSKLYEFNKEELKLPREIPTVPGEDEVLAKILITLDKWIFSYHKHDSLLENQENETLSEEERKLAWDEFVTEQERELQQAQPLPQAQFVPQGQSVPQWPQAQFRPQARFVPLAGPLIQARILTQPEKNMMVEVFRTTIVENNARRGRILTDDDASTLSHLAFKHYTSMTSFKNKMSAMDLLPPGPTKDDLIFRFFRDCDMSMRSLTEVLALPTDQAMEIINSIRQPPILP